MTDDELIAIAERAGLKQVQRLHNGGSLVTPTAVMRRFADAVQAAERKDAERYRWLRANMVGVVQFLGERGFGLSNMTGDDMDAAIDAAMKGTT